MFWRLAPSGDNKMGWCHKLVTLCGSVLSYVTLSQEIRNLYCVALEYDPSLNSTQEHPVTPNNTHHHPVALSNIQQGPASPSNTQQYLTVPNNTQQYPALPSNTQQHPAAPSSTQWLVVNFHSDVP